MSTTVVHNEFLICKKHTTDKYWQDIIHSCAHNKFPRGVKFDSGKRVIYVRYDMPKGRAKTEIFEVPPSSSDKEDGGDNDKKLFDLLIHIFRNILGLRSDKDISDSKQELEDIRKCGVVNMEVEWKKLKPRTLKNQIIMNFAAAQVEKHDLPESQIKHLYKIIQLGFQFKNLSGTDVHYEKGVITAIDGLEFDKKSNTFIITNPQKPMPKTEKQIIKTNKLLQTTDKWARDHKKYYS